MVPFYVDKNVLNLIIGNMRLIKKDNLRFAVATALSRFSEAILDYLNAEEAVEGGQQRRPVQLTRQDFSHQLDVAHDTLYSAWLTSSVLNSTR